jgi:uncharacterized protein (DUF1501 family)
MNEPKKPDYFWVNGIVAQGDKQPYIQLSNENGMLAQLSMAQARQVAQDILTMASRTEADAMLLKFFDRMEFPSGAASALMQEFRDYRATLDDEELDHTHRGEPEES